jgi:hypothetical protein
MGVRTISQEAFDDLVRENVEDLGMDPSEALEDALYTLKLQGVDLFGPFTFSPLFLLSPEIGLPLELALVQFVCLFMVQGSLHVFLEKVALRTIR